MYYNKDTLHGNVHNSNEESRRDNMARNYREYYWKRLDNAAKGFSAISSKHNTNVYRLSVLLKIPIEKKILQEALEKVLVEFPSYNVKQRKGFFWYYFESNFATPAVKEEQDYPCLKMERIADNGFLFRVTYFHNKINLEVFHSLTDGTGAVVFLKRLVYWYLSICFPEQKFTECEIFEKDCHPNEYDEDSFIKNYNKQQKKVNHNSEIAHRVRGLLLEKKVTRVTTGVMPANQVVAITKDKQVTVTEYLTAALIRAIYLGEACRRKSKKPIVICVPVNLRTFYLSHTLSNFFSYINVGTFIKKEYTFDDILQIVKNDFRDQLKQDKIEQKIRYNVEAETNLAVRFIPLFIKRLGLKAIHYRGERGQTSALSNLGIIDMPADIAKYVERFDMLISISSIKPIKTGVTTFNDKMSFTFTSSLLNTDIQQYFFSFLASQGIDVEIVSNEI